ncbi:MAG: asparagine synthase [Candidatus Marinimicrobia bacterium]|nr:asparagine synthase [Candidatus Neomarinimicrobiota bacterium]
MENNRRLNFRSISEWIATGFFLGQNGFYKDEQIPYLEFGPNFKWHYSPQEITFSETIDMFAYILKKVVTSKAKGKKVLLPLSGGLDSRTLAAALKKQDNIVAFSYEFSNGNDEVKYAREIAKTYGWDFYEYKIKEGYLWNKIDNLSDINKCYSEFTHPRQMAIIDQIKDLGNLFMLGHWGDVLFSLPQISNNANLEEQTEYALKMIAKPGGVDLAADLWTHWGLPGTFNDQLYNSIKRHLSTIKIEHPQSKIRAFKSLNWAKRWANPNLNIFKSHTNMFLPYYEKSMCDFVCKTPAKFLENRKIQIEYLKKYAPELAKINWQEYELNLYKYKYFNSLYLPKRAFKYFKRKLYPEQIIQRNWELQFLGSKNEKKLEHWLFSNKLLNNIVPYDIVEIYYWKFKNSDPVKYSHPISMLLTISVWSKKFLNIE